ncbi:MAG: nucleoside/nucleotide kinase family protein [Micromonosporaceae bacterium]
MSGQRRIVGLSQAVARGEELVAGGRRILGIAGPPGAGKSTLAAAVATALGERAVVVPMDGFHLAQVELARRGATARKGAPDTFDAAGYVALLRRLRTPESCVYAPAFRRDLEEPIAGAIPVLATVPLVVTEGNYLLGSGPWAPVAGLLDESWYVTLDEPTRLARLVARHAASGKSAEAARRWAHGSDQRNASLVEATQARADALVSDVT